MKLETLALTYTNKLKRNVKTYFKRAMELDQNYSYSKFYGTPKVHKTPTGFQLICATYRTYIYIWSDFCDDHLKILHKFLPSIIKDRNDLLRRLKAKGRLSCMGQLFLATAVAMYRNIDAIEALEAITNWINLLKMSHQKISCHMAFSSPS